MTDKCPTCGARNNSRWERITPGLVRTLVKFYTGICDKRINEVHLQRDLDLTKTEYNNFQKLRFFALAAKVRDKRGYWLLTWRGRDFLRNGARIPRSVLIRDNHIQQRSDELVAIKDVLCVEPYWLERDDFMMPAPVPATELRQSSLF